MARFTLINIYMNVSSFFTVNVRNSHIKFYHILDFALTHFFLYLKI